MKWENQPVLHPGIDLGFGFCRFGLRFEEYSGFRGELGGGSDKKPLGPEIVERMVGSAGAGVPYPRVSMWLVHRKARNLIYRIHLSEHFGSID